MTIGTELIISTTDLAVTVTEYVDKANELLEQGERAEITDQKTFDTGTDYRKIVTGLTTRLNEARTGLVKPYGDRIKLINNEFKRVSGILTKADGIVRGKMTTWYRDEEIRVRKEQEEAQRKADEEALEAAEKLEQKGEASTADAVLNLASESTPEPARVPTGRGALTGASSFGRKVWKGEVSDIKVLCRAIADGHLPEDLIEVRKTKLNELARNLQKEGNHHGIKISHETDLALR